MDMRKMVMALCLVIGAAASVLAQDMPAGDKPVTEPAPTKAEYRVEKDIAFLPAARAEKLDIYSPKVIADDAKLPLVIFIHGGGWVGGDKAERRAVNVAMTLVAEGYVVASVNYTLATAPITTYLDAMSRSFPQDLKDCKSAVRFLRKNAATYHLDPDRIAVMGGSAGGHLAAMVAYTGPADGFEPTDDGLGDVSSKVKAFVGLYGVYDWAAFAKKEANTDALKELCTKASPLTYLDKDDPPTYAIHGTKDTTVPKAQTEALEVKLKALGVENQVIIVPGAAHSFDFNLKLHDMRTDLIPFLAKYLKGDAVKTPPAPPVTPVTPVTPEPTPPPTGGC